MRLLNAVVCSAAMGFIAASAPAQDAPKGGAPKREGPPTPAMRGGGMAALARSPLPPDRAKAAWEFEAKHVAKGLNLSAEQTGSVVQAYVEARKDHMQAVEQLAQKARDSRRGGAGPDDDDAVAAPAQRNPAEIRKSIEELNAAQRQKLHDALAKTLNAEQLQKAMAPLGTFMPQWDVMVDAIVGFHLDQAKTDEAFNAIQRHVVTIGTARESADPDVQIKTQQDSRKQLGEAIKKLLTEEQYAKFQQAMSGRAPRGDGPGRGRDNSGADRPQKPGNPNEGKPKRAGEPGAGTP